MSNDKTEMIKWYKDEKFLIEFDKMPDVGISYPTPFYGKRENKEICKYPFINKSPLSVRITWLDEVFPFDIEEGYCWDGASIPKFFWRVIGSNTEPEFIIASLLHDKLCENHHYVNNNRYLSTIVLEKCLKVGGAGSFKRWLMKHCVDNFQKICGHDISGKRW